jgi:tetratricopeptide (TPR) repeat protein
MQQSQSDEENFGIEFLFGDGLYNYFREWVPENYKWLRAITTFFPRGDKVKGLQQLDSCARYAYYTRVEAQYFLARIYNNDENQPQKAYQIMTYLHQTYPANAYFHRYLATLSFKLGHWNQARQLSQEVLQQVNDGARGYEPVSGRYVTFILGYIAMVLDKDDKEAERQFKACKAFAEQADAAGSGYNLFALMYLGRIAERQGKREEAIAYMETVRDRADKDSDSYKEADTYLKKYKPRKKFMGVF